MKPLDYLKETKNNLENIKKEYPSDYSNNNYNVYFTKLYKDSIDKALEDVINDNEVKFEELDRIIGIKK